MAKQDTLPPRKSQKFFFDTNNFDEGNEEVIEEEEPPPPVFSESELAAAKEEAYTKGKQDGLDEAARSRETHIESILKNIETGLPSLLEQEDRRIALYEHEAVSLSLQIFKKLFPALNNKYGLTEIKEIIAAVLETQRACPEIIIEVQPDYVEDIEFFLNGAKENQDIQGVYTVKERPSLGPADCRLSWKDGGAKRDIETLKREIEKHLQETLADSGSMNDNDISDTDTANTHSTDPDHEEPIPKDDGE